MTVFNKAYIGASEAKVYLGSNLIINPVPVPWTPSNLSVAPTAWWDASDTASITESTNKVSQINSQVGTLHATQSTASYQPTSNTQTINSLNVLDFDGVDNFLDVPALSLTDGCYIIMLYQVTSANDAHGCHGCPTNHFDYNSGNGYSGLFRTTRRALRNIDSVASGVQVQSYEALASGPTYEFRRAGLVKDTDTASFTFSSNINSIGCGQNSPTSSCLNGVWGESIVLNYQPTTDEKERLEGYLYHKWNCVLDTGHTYYASAPTV